MASEIENERRREAAMLRRSSYFPAANLRQFEGTELSPPGAGTYYNPDRYRGFGGNIARVQRNLAQQYQQDLAFNAMANPRVAQALEAERIGAQYGGGKSFAGKRGYQTVQLPSGGTTVVTDAVAKRLSKIPGYTPAGGMARPSPAEAYNLGYSGQPSLTPRTPYERSYAMGYTGGREGAGVTLPSPPLPNLGSLAASALSGIGRFFGIGRPQIAAQPISSSGPIGYHTDFSGTPAALQEQFGQPRRYFDF